MVSQGEGPNICQRGTRVVPQLLRNIFRAHDNPCEGDQLAPVPMHLGFMTCHWFPLRTGFHGQDRPRLGSRRDTGRNVREMSPSALRPAVRFRQQDRAVSRSSLLPACRCADRDCGDLQRPGGVRPPCRSSMTWPSLSNDPTMTDDIMSRLYGEDSWKQEGIILVDL